MNERENEKRKERGIAVLVAEKGEGRRMAVVEGGGERIGGLFLINLLKISSQNFKF